MSGWEIFKLAFFGGAGLVTGIFVTILIIGGILKLIGD